MREEEQSNIREEILGIPLKQKALPGNFTPELGKPGLGKPGRVARGNRTSSYINILRGNYQATNHILFSDCKKKKTFIQIIKNGPFSNLRRHGTASSHWSCYQEGYETVQQTASVLDRCAKIAKKESFDPAKHMNFQPPKSIYTMEQIGLKGHGISPHAATEPFPLFTKDAITQMRAEIFDEKVLAECQYSSTFNKNMVRGMGPA